VNRSIAGESDRWTTAPKPEATRSRAIIDGH
jgi:hypothetical protein